MFVCVCEREIEREKKVFSVERCSWGTIDPLCLSLYLFCLLTLLLLIHSSLEEEEQEGKQNQNIIIMTQSPIKYDMIFNNLRERKKE